MSEHDDIDALNGRIDKLTSALKAVRAPSAVEIIGQRGWKASVGSLADTSYDGIVKGWLSASFNDANYQPGTFLTALMGARGTDADEQRQGKAILEGLGVTFGESPVKATTGASGSTGGYVLPNNLVDTLVKPETQEAVYSRLMTIRNGVNVRGADQPYRLGAPARMTFQDWNTSKENVNETYGSYTANLGTLARVMDITKQYARFSAGAAEQDVIDELTRAWALGENYYVMAGVGTGSVGTGDPTFGLYTALSTGPATYRTSFSPVATTLLGSAAEGFTSALSAMAARSQRPTAIVTDATTYWTILGQGSDTAGFWVAPETGPTGFSRLPNGGIAYWGVPLYYDSNFNTNTGSSKHAIMFDGTKFKIYRGQEFRIDTSDTAGTRFDYNLIGFRGEVEIGFDARPGVYTGAAQLITSLIA